MSWREQQQAVLQVLTKSLAAGDAPDGTKHTLAVDVDGTLAMYDHWRGEDHFGEMRADEDGYSAADAMRDLRDAGCRLCIWTTRGNTDKVRDWLEANSIPFDYINENPDQPPGTSDKIFCDLFIDDRNVDARKPWREIVREVKERLTDVPQHESGGKSLPPGQADLTQLALSRTAAVPWSRSRRTRSYGIDEGWGMRDPGERPEGNDDRSTHVDLAAMSPTQRERFNARRLLDMADGRSGGGQGQADRRSLREFLARTRQKKYGTKAWEESKHPRGQPENAGWFAETSGRKMPKGQVDSSQRQAQGEPQHHPGAAHGSAVKVKPVKQRAWNEQSVSLKTTLSKQETGRVGEAIGLAWLKANVAKDARPMNTAKTNFPIDLIEDHAPTEVKAGLASNARKSEQWRLTFSKETKAEIEAYEKMTPEERTAWNEQKQQRIHERKQKVIKELEKKYKRKIKPRTLTLIINPDTKTADIYLFDGFHDRIDWRSEAARKAYRGSVQYAHDG